MPVKCCTVRIARVCEPQYLRPIILSTKAVLLHCETAAKVGYVAAVKPRHLVSKDLIDIFLTISADIEFTTTLS